MVIGVLAIQGNFAEHQEILWQLKHDSLQVRTVADLAQIDHLVIPGGESTTIMRFLTNEGLGQAISERVREGNLSLFATCAGAIVIAKEVVGEERFQPLSLLDITIDRNAYGRQIASFTTDLTVSGVDQPLHVSFIRAPIITQVGSAVEVLAEYEDQPVLVRSGNILAATFHPEMHGEVGIHKLWLQAKN